MPIDPRMVKWDDEPPAIDPRMVKWDKPAAAPMKAKGAAKRTAGEYAQLGGRAVAQGTSGALDMLSTGMKMFPGLSLYSAATKDLPSLRGAADLALTDAGVARPRTPGERVASDVGEALTGTALTLGAGAATNARFLSANPVL